MWPPWQRAIDVTPGPWGPRGGSLGLRVSGGEKEAGALRQARQFAQ